MANTDFPFAFSVKHSLGELDRTLNTIEAIKAGLSANASAEEKAALDKLIKALGDAKATVKLGTKDCPNGMFFTFTIKASELGKIGKTQG